MKTYRLVAAMPGRAIGITIFVIVFIRPQPSIIAASSTLSGTAAK